MDIHLTIKNLNGSVEHYWHFFMGFYIPLLDWLNNAQVKSDTQLFIRSCGPLDKHLIDLKIVNLIILDKAEHEHLKTHKNPNLSYIEITGMDLSAAYNYRRIQIAIKQLKNRLNITFKQKANNSILCINRDKPHEFYLSEKAEKPGAGTSRRSIPNFNEIVESLAKVYSNIEIHYLETYTMRQQYECFWNAKTIIYQHGAAMANLCFARPGTTVIEIVPNDLPIFAKKQAWALQLCKVLHLNYHCVTQDSQHSDVDPTLIIDAIKIKKPLAITNHVKAIINNIKAVF